LKTDGKATATLEEFAITATIKSQHGVTNVYSPTHAVSLQRKSDNEVVVTFDPQPGPARQGLPALLLHLGQGTLA